MFRVRLAAFVCFVAGCAAPIRVAPVRVEPIHVTIDVHLHDDDPSKPPQPTKPN